MLKLSNLSELLVSGKCSRYENWRLQSFLDFECIWIMPTWPFPPIMNPAPQFGNLVNLYQRWNRTSSWMQSAAGQYYSGRDGISGVAQQNKEKCFWIELLTLSVSSGLARTSCANSLANVISTPMCTRPRRNPSSISVWRRLPSYVTWLKSKAGVFGCLEYFRLKWVRHWIHSLTSWCRACSLGLDGDHLESVCGCFWRLILCEGREGLLTMIVCACIVGRRL